MIIECYRGVGDREGLPIFVPLLADSVLLDRGTAEINANAHSVVTYSLNIVPKPSIRLGQLIQFSDSTTTRVGKITGISLSLRGGEFEQQLNVEVAL